MESSSSGDTVRTILVVGALGLDRLLSVKSYPEADQKVRTTAYHEVGGGNAANTASAMAMLSDAACFRRCSKFNIQLLTKVAPDAIGRQLIKELETVHRVDLCSPLFCVSEPGTRTPFTTIIVSENGHTRTCIHTPGTCGELTKHDVEKADMDHIFHPGVVHLHSDARHSDAALLLAKEARKRGIPVSIDIEKNRHDEAVDQLLECATMIFTNTMQIEDYLICLSEQLEQKTGRKLLKTHSTIATPNNDGKVVLRDQVFLRAIQPSSHFCRWFDQTEKQVVVTKGSMGALHIQSIRRTDDNKMPPTHLSVPDYTVTVHHETTEDFPGDTNETFAKSTRQDYAVHHSGPLSKPTIVDTTGAGDAFIGAFILMQQHLQHAKIEELPSTNEEDPVQLSLEFGCWVAGRKLSGAGARSALPRGSDVDQTLGTDLVNIQRSLQKVLLPFGENLWRGTV